jgi:hypothetical protein
VVAILVGFELLGNSGWEVARVWTGLEGGNVAGVLDVGDVLAEETSSNART